MKTKLLPFENEMLPEAGELLAKRHQRNRKTLPLLPARFERPDIAVKALEFLLDKKNTKGYAAIRNGKLVAYFLGENNVMLWGRGGWVHLPGSGLAKNESVETLQDLYVKLGEDWVKKM